MSELHLPEEGGVAPGGVGAPSPPPPPAFVLTSEDEDPAPSTPRSVISPSAVPPASCGDVLAAFAAARAGGVDTTPGACLREFLLEHAGASPGGIV